MKFLVFASTIFMHLLSTSAQELCEEIEDGVDYDYASNPSQLLLTNRSTAEECCEDCNRYEAVCDFYTWTPQNDGVCELKQFQYPITKIEREDSRSAVLLPCRCTKGTKCNDGKCTGCTMFGTCYNYDAMGCRHGGGKMCDGSATTMRVTTTRVPTTQSPFSTTVGPPTTTSPPETTMQPNATPTTSTSTAPASTAPDSTATSTSTPSAVAKPTTQTPVASISSLLVADMAVVSMTLMTILL